MADTLTARQIRQALILAMVPVVVALLIQRPELRQALIMRAAHASRMLCQAQADLWQRLATASAQTYNKARM